MQTANSKIVFSQSIAMMAVALVVLLLSGCFTPNIVAEGDASITEKPTDVVCVQANPPATTNTVDILAAVKPVTAPQKKVVRAKPRSVSYVNGRQIAKVDNVMVYLGEPTKVNPKTKKFGPSSLDRRLTISPILEPRTKPFVSGRAPRVCLDPGHGGTDSGALSMDKRLQEQAVVLDIAKRVERLLKADGFEVMLTRRSENEGQPLDNRTTKAWRWRADAFVSIHLNANVSSVHSGTETYALPPVGMESTSYSGVRASPESRRKVTGNDFDIFNIQLAYNIQRCLLAATGAKDRGVRRARWAVLREASMPATLVECAFISSSSEIRKLRTAEYRDKIARGIYEGIRDFFYGIADRDTPTPTTSPTPSVATKPTAVFTEFVPDAFEKRWTPPPPPPPSDDPEIEATRRKAQEAAGLLPK